MACPSQAIPQLDSIIPNLNCNTKLPIEAQQSLPIYTALIDMPPALQLGFGQKHSFAGTIGRIHSWKTRYSSWSIADLGYEEICRHVSRVQGLFCCSSSDRSRLRAELAPLLHDLLVKQRHFKYADRENTCSEPLHDVKHDAMWSVGEPAAAIPHPRVRVPGLADVDDYHGEREGEAQGQRGAKVIGPLPPLPVSQVTFALAAPPEAKLKHVCHHNRCHHRLKCIKGVLEAIIDVVIGYGKDPANEYGPASGANQGWDRQDQRADGPSVRGTGWGRLL